MASPAGAAGALAGIICAMTIDTGHIHPTINYDDPDPACALPGIMSARLIPDRRDRLVTILVAPP